MTGMQEVQQRGYLIGDIKHSLLDLLINFTGCVDERLRKPEGKWLARCCLGGQSVNSEGAVWACEAVSGKRLTSSTL